MSIFPVQFIEDMIMSATDDQQSDDNGSTATGDESSDYSDSAMFSNISTDSTTDLTLVDPPSAVTMEAPDSPTPSLGDHGAAIMPPGLFIEIYREQQQLARNEEADDDTGVSEFGGTIVSSAASGVEIESPPLETSWTMAPPPRSIHRENASISTTESMYRELASLEGDFVEPHPDDDRSVESHDLSLRPSMMDSSLSAVSIPSASENLSSGTTDQHERTTFVNVADRLALQTIREDQSEWFERFTDRDWLNFQRDADMILSAIDPNASTTTRIAMPPAPPVVLEDRSRESAASNEEAAIPAPSCLSSSFICRLCDDVVVGATTLDCACPQSTVCMACWEKNQTKVVDNEDDSELEDLVFMGQHRHDSPCPFCDKPSARAIPCHALDVAILECVKCLPETYWSVQTAYYRRLAAWREEVQRRCGTDSVKSQQEREELLAELIRREEEFFLEKEKTKQPFWQSHKGLQIAAEIVFLAAGVALCGGPLARAFSLALRRR